MTPPNGMREYLELLEDHGQLARISEPVTLEPGVREIAGAAASDRDHGPAVLLDNLVGASGARIAVNVHGSFANLAVLLGMSPQTTTRRQMFEELCRRWRPQPRSLVHVDNAPVHQVRSEKESVDLFAELPLFRVNPYDGGMYIAKACTVSRDPHDRDDVNKQNVGIYRIQVHGGTTVSIMTAASHDLGRQIVAAERDGLPLHVAITIGPHPAVALFGGTPLGYEQSEYAYAAAAFGHELRLTTSGNGLDVLADAEMIIEAELQHGQRIVEGPFGEFPGTYTDTCLAPVFGVTAISRRHDPIFENIYLGNSWGELDTLIGLNTCVPVYADLHSDFPEVVAVNAMYQHGLTAVISVRNRFAGFAKAVAHRAIGSTHGLQYLKNIILVDDDVDPFDLERVMWSLSTRTRATDIDVLPICRSSP